MGLILIELRTKIVIRNYTIVKCIIFKSSTGLIISFIIINCNQAASNLSQIHEGQELTRDDERTTNQLMLKLLVSILEMRSIVLILQTFYILFAISHD